MLNASVTCRRWEHLISSRTVPVVTRRLEPVCAEYSPVCQLILCCSWWGFHPTRRSCACRRMLLILQLTAVLCGFGPLSGVQEGLFMELFSGNSACRCYKGARNYSELKFHSDWNKWAVISNITLRLHKEKQFLACFVLQMDWLCRMAQSVLWHPWAERWDAGEVTGTIVCPQCHRLAKSPIAAACSAWCEMGTAAWEVSCPLMALFFLAISSLSQ